jgi:hypothetical protein
MLSAAQYQKIVRFIEENARPLEKARLHYHIAGGSRDAVLDALLAYQNSDGGFGHALEPDVRLAQSSVIATTIAFQRFREVNAPSDYPPVRRAFEYLLGTYDADNHIWRNVPPDVSDAPHAPWWTYAENPQQHGANPRAEIAGYFYEYPAHAPDTLRQELTDAVITHLDSYNGDIEMHDLLCYVSLVETDELPDDVSSVLLKKLIPLVKESVSTDPDAWGEYGLMPLSVVSSPESPFYELFEALIPRNLAYLADTLSGSGFWSLPWSWEHVSEAAWAQAEQEWQGVVALENLLMFRRFDAIEASDD